MTLPDILDIVGSYVTYDEFVKECPEIDISKNEWYRLNKGRNYQKTKSELKQTYSSQFQEDWARKRKIAFNLLKNASK